MVTIDTVTMAPTVQPPPLATCGLQSTALRKVAVTGTFCQLGQSIARPLHTVLRGSAALEDDEQQRGPEADVHCHVDGGRDRTADGASDAAGGQELHDQHGGGDDGHNGEGDGLEQPQPLEVVARADQREWPVRVVGSEPFGVAMPPCSAELVVLKMWKA